MTDRLEDLEARIKALEDWRDGFVYTGTGLVARRKEGVPPDPEQMGRSARAVAALVFDEGSEIPPRSLALDQAPRTLAEWHEDYGAVLWWRFPVEEPPYCGSPLDSEWPGYHTHWTQITIPREP